MTVCKLVGWGRRGDELSSELSESGTGAGHLGIEIGEDEDVCRVSALLIDRRLMHFHEGLQTVASLLSPALLTFPMPRSIFLRI